MWVQCCKCSKWRIIKETELSAPEAARSWVCSMNSDIRHNSCAAPQHLHEKTAPEDGEVVKPRGYTTRSALESELDALPKIKLAELHASLQEEEMSSRVGAVL